MSRAYRACRQRKHFHPEARAGDGTLLGPRLPPFYFTHGETEKPEAQREEAIFPKLPSKIATANCHCSICTRGAEARTGEETEAQPEGSRA